MPAPTTDDDTRLVRRCRFCRAATVLVARTVNNAEMPLNVRPDPAGNVTVTRDSTGIYADVKGPAAADEARARGAQMWMPHVATCTAPPQRKHRPRRRSPRR